MGPASDVRRGEGKPYLFVRSKGEELIPSARTLDIGARIGQYNIRVLTGQAQDTNLEDLSSLQNADFVGDVGEYRAHWFGIAKRLSIPETWSEKFTKVNTMQERDTAAIMALDDFQEQRSRWGSAEKAIIGAFTMPNAAFGIGGAAFQGGTVDAQEMMRVIATIEAQFMAGNNDQMPWGGVMARADMSIMKSTFFSGTTTSAWSKALEDFPWMRNMKSDRALDRSNAGGTGPRWVIIGSDQDHLHNEVTDTMVFGPFTKDLVTYWYMVRRHGGIIAKMPEMVLYMDFTL
jgi:hypothetical protein